MALTIHSITFDCAKPDRLAEFWSAALGYTVAEADDEGAVVVPTDGHGSRLLFLTVPEGKSVKNRVHLDLTAADMGAEVERLVGLGARKVRVFGHDPNDTFTVMQDPEGNEFCVEQGRP